MERRGIFRAGLMLGLVALGFVVPYTVLSGVDAWYGSFLFWVVFALAALLMNYLITRDWKD